MRGPGSQKFSSFIRIFSWLDEEGSAAVPGGLRFPEYQASAPCWVGPITASLRKRGPQMEYSGVPVSQGGVGQVSSGLDFSANGVQIVTKDRCQVHSDQFFVDLRGVYSGRIVSL